MEGILTYIYVGVVVLLLFGAAIFVHEFGHFWVALKRGLKVEEFAIGFGPVLWSKEVDGILYSIRWIPAGGFVKLPQMLTSEAIEGKAENEGGDEDEAAPEPEELPPVSPLSKILVAFAGPLMNVLFAIVIAVFLWGVGIPKQVNDPVIGYVGKSSDEYALGVRPGDVVQSINGQQVESWHDVIYAVLDSSGPTVKAELLRGKEKLTVDLPADTWDGGIRRLHLDNHDQLAVASVEKKSLLFPVGFEQNDSILKVNDVQPFSQYHFVDLLMESPGAEKTITVRRKGNLERLTFTTPEQAGVSVGLIPEPEHGTWDLILSKLGKDLKPLEKTPAMKAGIKEDDIIHKVNGQRITSTRHLVDIIQANGDQEMTIELIRDSKTKTITATPKDKRLGIALEHDLGLFFLPEAIKYGQTLAHPNPAEQFGDVLYKVGITFKALSRGSESGVGAKDLSGPIGIFGMLAIQVKHDLRLALSFLVLLNINLAILNLLPVPVLDGGHILMSLIEWIRKKPVSVRLQEYATTVFAVVLITFFLYVTFADVKRVPLLHDIFQRETQTEPSE
jgi:regulator of sigma E protease